MLSHVEDMRPHLAKLRADAADCATVAARATDSEKRELFTRLASHLGVLADALQRAIANDDCPQAALGTS
jgi:hypothetical protein